MTISPVDPLNWKVPISDGDGHPTPFFIRQWQNLIRLVTSVTAAQAAADAAQAAADAAAADAAAAQAAADALELPQYLTLAATSTLTNERVLTPGTGLSGTDAGAGSTYTLAISSSYYPVLPLTNGDTTTPGLVYTPDAQCIGVPLY